VTEKKPTDNAASLRSSRHRRRGNDAGVKFATDTMIFVLKMSTIPDEAENAKLESPSRFTGLCQSQGNRIIAANNPI
jgi:hypothetical protein